MGHLLSFSILVLCPVQDFYIVDARDNQVFIAASHRGGTVSLYVSDVTGQFYVKSLDHVVAFVHRDNFILDLYEVYAITITTTTTAAAASTTTTTTFSFYCMMLC